jgi:hypothetical protein
MNYQRSDKTKTNKSLSHRLCRNPLFFLEFYPEVPDANLTGELVGASQFLAEGGHAAGHGVAAEHPGACAHPWAAIVQPTATRGTLATCAGGPAAAAPVEMAL